MFDCWEVKPVLHVWFKNLGEASLYLEFNVPYGLKYVHAILQGYQALTFHRYLKTRINGIK